MRDCVSRSPVRHRYRPQHSSGSESHCKRLLQLSLSRYHINCASSRGKATGRLSHVDEVTLDLLSDTHQLKYIRGLLSTAEVAIPSRVSVDPLILLKIYSSPDTSCASYGAETCGGPCRSAPCKQLDLWVYRAR